MSDKIFHITGRVIDRESGEGLAGLRVEAWDKDLICDDFVSSAVTDDQGAFNDAVRLLKDTGIPQPGRVHSMHHKQLAQKRTML